MEDARIHTSADSRVESSEGCSGLDNPDEQLRCVFSSTTEIRIGTGTTAKKQISKLLWYVNQCGLDEYGIRKINPNFVPVGEEDLIDQEKLLTDYTPEVEIHNARVMPAMRALKKTIAKGDKHRENGEPLSAEMEYTRALDVDETNVRAIFGLGLVYLDRKDKDKSRGVFEQLVSLQGAFHENHKHLFNEFGIALRKNGLYDESVQYYTRAVELTKNDENLYYNLARAFYEKGDWEYCFTFASKALDINAYHEHAIAMCRFMMTLAGNENLRTKYDKPPVPADLVAQASARLGIDASDEHAMVEIDPDGFGTELVSGDTTSEK
ncbi:tetratricopeptide repeat protein [Pseudodesulfovibrio piezophilus]|nr:tetratricopeptide repeat protein [Pseudodesulfovibrio piezophilus]